MRSRNGILHDCIGYFDTVTKKILQEKQWFEYVREGYIMAFQIIRKDITKVSADAIVNTANPKPEYAGGTDYAIYMAAGADELLEERKKIGDIEMGQAAATPAFALNARYIIHTVGPSWVDGNHGEREAVRSCYENSLKLAMELGCESIAFPLIATGVYGFPKADALQIAVSVFSAFLAEKDMLITLVVFDEASFPGKKRSWKILWMRG